MNPFLKIKNLTELILNSKYIKLMTDDDGRIQNAYAWEEESHRFYPVQAFSGKYLANCSNLELVKKMLETMAIVRKEQYPALIPIQFSTKGILVQLDVDISPGADQNLLITLMHQRSDPEINIPPIPVHEQQKLIPNNLLHQAIQKLLGQLDELCFVLTTSGKFIYSNLAFQKMIGYSKDDLVQMVIFDLVPAHQKILIDRWFSTPREDHHQGILLKFFTKTGEEIGGITRFLTHHDGAQNSFIIGFFRKEELNSSELNGTLYDQIIRVASKLSLPMLMIEEGSLRILFANPASDQYYEFDEGELSKKNFLDLFSPSENQHLMRLLRDEGTFGLESDYAWNQITRTGLEKKSRLLVNPLILENQKISLILLRDPVQEKKNYIIKEEPENPYLRKQELLMVNLAPSGVVTQVNQAFCEIMGKPLQYIIGKTFEEIIYLEDYREIYQHFSQLTPQNPERKNRNRIIDGNGKTHWIEWTDRGIFHGDQLSEIQSTGKDITATYQSELLQISMEQRYQSLVENLPLMVYVIHAETFFPFYVSPQVEELSGYKQEEFYKYPQIWTDAMPSDNAKKYYDILHQRIEKKVSGPIEFQIIRRDGQQIWIEEIGTTIELSDGTLIYQGTARDVTERHNYQEKIVFYSNFESAINEFSLKLLKATPENIDETIQFIVDELGTIMQVDRAYIFGFDHNAHTMSNTFEWCQPGVTPMINQLQNLEFSKYFWWMKRLNNHLEIVLHCIDELPPEAASEKENLISQGIKSLLAVPLIYEGRAMGFIGFDMVLHETHWEQKSINLLHYVSAIIMNTMQRFVHHLNGKANLQAR